MTRLLTTCVTLTGVLATALAAPLPEEARRPPLYHATAVGAMNTYRWANGTEFTDEVIAVEGKRVTYRQTAKAGTAESSPVTFKVEVSAEGVRVTDIGIDSTRLGFPAYWSFKPPPARWQFATFTPPGQTTHTMTSFPPERVTVPAGTFAVVRVHDVWACKADGFGPQERTEWWAPGVGVVKMVYEDQTGKQSFVLQSFTPGKQGRVP